MATETAPAPAALTTAELAETASEQVCCSGVDYSYVVGACPIDHGPPRDRSYSPD